MRKLLITLASLIVLAGCRSHSDSSHPEGLSITELPPSCSTYIEEMVFVNPFETPIIGLYDFNQIRKDMIGADDSSITHCVERLAKSTVHALSETEFKNKQTADIIFYSLRTEDEYDANDISALHFHYRLSFENDSGVWSQKNLKESLDKDIWKHAK